MAINIVKYKEWTFEVDRELTEQTYRGISGSGADTCGCIYCLNYVTYRDNVFPKEILDLFFRLGIDYRKEAEITTYNKLPVNLYKTGGWFHFKGHVLEGNDYRVPSPSGGNNLDFTPIFENFAIGFSAASDLTFFEDITGLVQVEFITDIPWVIDKKQEPEW